VQHARKGCDRQDQTEASPKGGRNFPVTLRFTVSFPFVCGNVHSAAGCLRTWRPFRWSAVFRGRVRIGSGQRDSRVVTLY
jgi:hypothetical protein